MGRPKSVEPSIVKTLSLRASVIERVELMLYDPIRGKTKYGSMASLVNRLLEKYANGEIQLDEQE